MNLILGLLLAVILIMAAVLTYRRSKKGGACCGEHETVEKRKAKDRNPRHYPYQVKLSIGGMTCENCTRRIENAFHDKEGMLCKVSLEKKEALVYLKEPPEEDKLKRTVTEAGYVVMGVVK